MFVRPARTAALLSAALVLAACASDPGAASDGGTAGSSGSADAFPVSIEHKFGATDIDAEPVRIVALGYTELDSVLALGEVPVAARWPQTGPTDTSVRSWNAAALETAGGGDPQVLQYPFGEINVEEVASLQPDLILATTAGITEAEYDDLSAIAPTLAQSGDYLDFGMPWQEVTTSIGTALGKQELAGELVGNVEAQVAAARESLPELDGASVASAYYGGTEVLVFASQDLRARFFTDLGMVVPAEIDELAGESFYATVSLERLDTVDTDVLVWNQLQFVEGGREAIEADPLVAGLDATQDGRTVFIGGEVDDALQVSSVLSLPAALEGIVPLLEQASP